MDFYKSSEASGDVTMQKEMQIMSGGDVFDAMSDAEVVALMDKPEFVNLVRKKICYGVLHIEQSFVNHNYGAVEWRRRQFKLAQDVIKMVQEELCKNGQ